MKHLLVIAHILLQLVAFTSWLWVDYRIILTVAAGHLAMLILLKGCPLSLAQFKGADKRFYEWELEKFGVRMTAVTRGRLRIFMQYILPVVIVVLAMLLQYLGGVTPLIGL